MERRWAIMRANKDYMLAEVDAYIPRGHRVLAIRDMGEFAEYLIDGPHFPIATDTPPIVEMVCVVEVDGVYAYWSHRPQVRWLVAASPAVIGD